MRPFEEIFACIAFTVVIVLKTPAYFTRYFLSLTLSWRPQTLRAT